MKKVTDEGQLAPGMLVLAKGCQSCGGAHQLKLLARGLLLGPDGRSYVGWFVDGGDGCMDDLSAADFAPAIKQGGIFIVEDL
jgi:hypothetical protein